MEKNLKKYKAYFNVNDLAGIYTHKNTKIESLQNSQYLVLRSDNNNYQINLNAKYCGIKKMGNKVFIETTILDTIDVYDVSKKSSSKTGWNLLRVMGFDVIVEEIGDVVVKDVDKEEIASLIQKLQSLGK